MRRQGPGHGDRVPVWRYRGKGAGLPAAGPERPRRVCARPDGGPYEARNAESKTVISVVRLRGMRASSRSAPIAAACIARSSSASTNQSRKAGRSRFSVTLPASQATPPVDGRLLVMIAKDREGRRAALPDQRQRHRAADLRRRRRRLEAWQRGRRSTARRSDSRSRASTTFPPAPIRCRR